MIDFPVAALPCWHHNRSMVRAPSRNEKREVLTTLQELVVQHCEQTFRDIFKEPVPQGWSESWLARFDSYSKQELEARRLVSGIAKNQQGVAAHAQRIRQFLAKNGVDPQKYDFNRDFGARMALTGAARWLLDSWGDIQAARSGGPRPIGDMKSYYERSGPLPLPNWIGFMLAFFSWLPAQDDQTTGVRWGDRPHQDMPLSDSEIAALSVLIFGVQHPAFSSPIVESADVGVQTTPIGEIMERHRRRVARARRDLVAKVPATGYEGPGFPSAGESVANAKNTPAVPWPQPWEPISLDEYIYECCAK